MHIDELELIGKGSTASVYKYGDDKVLKVYDSKRYRDRPDFVKREADITRAVCESGLPAADCRGLIDVDGFHCAIYDMAEGNLWVIRYLQSLMSLDHGYAGWRI